MSLAEMPLKDQIYEIVIRGFLPLAMVGAVLLGAYKIIDRQLDADTRARIKTATEIKAIIHALDENVNRLRRDVLRAAAQQAAGKPINPEEAEAQP